MADVLCGVSLGPELGYPVVLLSVLQELGCDAPDQRVGGVAVGQERANTQQHLANNSIQCKRFFNGSQKKKSFER